MVSKREIKKRVKKMKFGRKQNGQMGEREATTDRERRRMGEAERGEVRELGRLGREK